jgi:hypothetical protein
VSWSSRVEPLLSHTMTPGAAALQAALAHWEYTPAPKDEGTAAPICSEDRMRAGEGTVVESVNTVEVATLRLQRQVGPKRAVLTSEQLVDPHDEPPGSGYRPLSQRTRKMFPELMLTRLRLAAPPEAAIRGSTIPTWQRGQSQH